MQAKSMASNMLALSIFSLAAALVYFTWQIASISEKIPDILTSVEKTSLKIEPMLVQVGDINKQIPHALNEVTEIRKQIPLILEEVKLVREKIPNVLNTVEKASNVVEQVTLEVKEARPLVPKILNEVKLTREAIPPMLDRADKLAANVRNAGKEASKGAVTGLFTGIIAAPFTMVQNLGKKMFGFSAEESKDLTKEDLYMIEQTAKKVISSNKENESANWENPENHTRGKVTFVKAVPSDEEVCKILNIKNWRMEKVITEKRIEVCQDETGVWELQK